MNKTRQVRISSPLFSGLLYSLVFMAIGTLIVSLIMLLTGTQESILPTLSFIIHGISLFIGGWVAGKRAGSRGWHYGGLLGILYCLIIYLVGFLAYDTSLNMDTLKLLGISFASGAIGGILGVNTGK